MWTEYEVLGRLVEDDRRRVHGSETSTCLVVPQPRPTETQNISYRDIRTK